MTDRLDTIDAQTLALAIQLYLDDADNFQAHRKGKNRQGDITDEDLVMEMWQAELLEFSQLAMDRALGESTVYAMDVQAAEDRTLALEMSETGYVAGASPTSTPAVPDLDDELEAQLRELNLSLSTQAAQDSRSARPKPQVVCIACDDDFAVEDTFRMPCGHAYCYGCIESLVTASIADESLFPPRCCNRPLPLALPMAAHAGPMRRHRKCYASRGQTDGSNAAAATASWSSIRAATT
ncbi:hypothetical protein SCUCBS95973_006558 [Sporothrix curviconia]|uniref:RING-type domain-containing protein n=1 Tax=Sporothrix curviconia TaxID=1260050 RepID=A0ABP0C655_9PEZI